MACGVILAALDGNDDGYMEVGPRGSRFLFSTHVVGPVMKLRFAAVGTAHLVLRLESSTRGAAFANGWR